MKLFLCFTVYFVCAGLVACETGAEELGDSSLYDYGEDPHEPEIPATHRKLVEDDAIPSDPVSVNKFIQEFHQQVKEEQELAVVAPLPVNELNELQGPNITANTSNGSALSTEESTTNTTSTLVACITGKHTGGGPVELVNTTRLLNVLFVEPNITNRRTLGECVAVLFFARYCPFSCMAAPHFNALPRAFPDIKMTAVDAMKYPSFNTQYGIVGVPTVMLFHNGRPAAKFNDSEYTLEMFARFITKYTGLEPQHKLYVTSADFGGPVPSVPTKETDYCLALSWIFILICSVYFFSKSSWWQWIVEAAQNMWREAEAQHEHGD